MKALTGRDGFKVLEFVGPGSGSRSFWGRETGTRYIFGNNNKDKIKYVDIADADHFLDEFKNGKRLFSIYVAPKEEKVKVEPKEVARVKGDIESAGDYNGDGAIDYHDNIHLAATVIEANNATAAAWRVAQENGVDITQVTGTGKDGRITKRDVEDFNRVVPV